MMISLVVVGLALVASTFALPVTPEGQIATGIEGVPQIHTGTPVTAVPYYVEKTGVQVSPEIYKPLGHEIQQETSSGTPHQYAGVNSFQEKTSVQVPSEIQTGQQQSGYSLQNTPVPKVENAPLNVDRAQSSFTETPVLLPIQPLSVLPVNQVGQISRPIIVPSEAITSGRVIIMAMDSIQQREYPQGIVDAQEMQPSYPKAPQTVVYTPVQTQVVEPNQQPYYVQQVQTEIQPVSETYNPVQVQPDQEAVVKGQTASVTNAVRQTVESVPSYNDGPVVAAESVVKQGSDQVVDGCGSAQSQFLEPVQRQQQNPIHQTVEKHVQPEYVPVQGQSHDLRPVTVQSAEKQAPYQPSVQTQNFETDYQQPQNVDKQMPSNKVTENAPAESQQPFEQQVYNVQPVQNQVYNAESVQQQVQNVESTEEKIGNYQPGSAPAQNQAYETQQPVQTVQRGAESPVPVQTAENVQDQNQLVKEQQQVLGVQPVRGQVESQIPHQQTTGYVEQVKTSEVEPNQQLVGAQPQQTVNYQFGDKIPQVQQQNVPARPVYQPVQPSVGLTQQ